MPDDAAAAPPVTEPADDLLVGSLEAIVAAGEVTARVAGPPSGICLEPMTRGHAPGLAACYLAAYPPHIGAASLAEALEEMHSTFAGAYGELIPPASLVAVADGVVAGSVMVVHRSPWDEDLDCPFVIEVFVHPDHRGRGLARALLARAARACLDGGESVWALRVGEGTSPTALRLYARAGMHPRADPPG